MFRKYSILVILLVVGLVQMGCSSPLVEDGLARAIPWWVWVLVVVVLLALWVWWSRSRPEGKEVPTAKPEATAPIARPEAAAPSHVVETPEGVARRAPPVLSEVAGPMPDDLTRIEGIGPKISGLLQAAGIMTFAQLATTDVSRLKQTLTDAGLITLADPTTWPEQASLAAAGQWDALETLQDELKGGRRV